MARAPFPRELQGLAHYLPLHMALETLAIVVGALIFAVGWHTPRRPVPSMPSYWPVPSSGWPFWIFRTPFLTPACRIS